MLGLASWGTGWDPRFSDKISSLQVGCLQYTEQESIRVSSLENLLPGLLCPLLNTRAEFRKGEGSHGKIEATFVTIL